MAMHLHLLRHPSFLLLGVVLARAGLTAHLRQAELLSDLLPRSGNIVATNDSSTRTVEATKIAVEGSRE